MPVNPLLAKIQQQQAQTAQINPASIFNYNPNVDAGYSNKPYYNPFDVNLGRKASQVNGGTGSGTVTNAICPEGYVLDEVTNTCVPIEVMEEAIAEGIREEPREEDGVREDRLKDEAENQGATLRDINGVPTWSASEFKPGETLHGRNYARFDGSQGFQAPGLIGAAQGLLDPRDEDTFDRNLQNPYTDSIVSEGYDEGEVDPALARAAGYTKQIENTAGNYGVFSGRGRDAYGKRGVVGDIGGWIGDRTGVTNYRNSSLAARDPAAYEKVLANQAAERRAQDAELRARQEAANTDNRDFSDGRVGRGQSSQDAQDRAVERAQQQHRDQQREDSRDQNQDDRGPGGRGGGGGPQHGGGRNDGGLISMNDGGQIPMNPMIAYRAVGGPIPGQPPQAPPGPPGLPQGIPPGPQGVQPPQPPMPPQAPPVPPRKSFSERVMEAKQQIQSGNTSVPEAPMPQMPSGLMMVDGNGDGPVEMMPGAGKLTQQEVGPDMGPDTIDSELEEGSFVMNPEASEMYGDEIRAMVNGGYV